MTGSSPSFEMHENRAGRRLRLTLTGELDLVSVPELDVRLGALRVRKRPVTLDLSKLAFIDSTGLHLLIRVVREARAEDWDLRVAREVSPPVSRLFKLVQIDRFLFGTEAAVPPQGRGRLRPASPEVLSATAPPEVLSVPASGSRSPDS
jgi:anti-anti-sigma factor